MDILSKENLKAAANINYHIHIFFLIRNRFIRNLELGILK